MLHGKRRSLLVVSALFIATAATACSSRTAPTRQAGNPQAAATTSVTATAAAVAASLTPRVANDLLYLHDGTGGTGDRLLEIEATTGQQSREMRYGVAVPDWSALYATQIAYRNDTTQTTVSAIDPHAGQTMRETAVDGAWELPHANISGAPGGLSQNGGWLALTEPFTGAQPRKHSHFLVLDTSFSQPPRDVSLDGNFWVDALSNDGTNLYLIENIPAGALGTYASIDYQVRRYDLAQGALDPNIIVAKGEDPLMRGNRVAAIPSHNGDWLYSLYISGSRGPFIHALSLRQPGAVCIDLPAEPTSEQSFFWSLAMSPDGKTLYAANAALGRVAQIDLANFRVRSATLARQPASVGPLTRLARWLAPTTEAKGLIGRGAALSPDGRTLVVLAEHGLLMIKTADLSVQSRYLADQTLNSVAFSPDGMRLYATSAPRGSVLTIDASSGAIVTTMQRPAGGEPEEVLRVEAAP